VPDTSAHSLSECRRARRLWLVFNLLPEEYTRIVNYQGGGCAICKKEPPKGKSLAVDHSHASGLIRGALCWPCNRLLGAARDNRELLFHAASYLTSPPAIQALGHPQYGLTGRVGTKKQRRILKRLRRLARPKKGK